MKPADVSIGSPKNREQTAARPKGKAADDLASLRKREIAAGRWWEVELAQWLPSALLLLCRFAGNVV